MDRKIAACVTISILSFGLIGVTLTLTGQERDRAKIPDNTNGI